MASLTGFLVAGLFEWNLGDEELVDFLCVLVGTGYAASRWRTGAGRASAREEAAPRGAA
jgi:hypothetical protein